MINKLLIHYIYSKSLAYIVKLYKILILIFGAIIFIPQYNTGSKPWIYITKIASPFFIFLAKIIFRSFFKFLPANALDFRMELILFCTNKIAYRIKRIIILPIHQYKNVFFKPIFFKCLGKN